MATVNDTRGRPELTLGPLLYHRDGAAWRDFYHRIADEAPVDTVIVGEVVCSKRQSFIDDELPGVVERLQRAGKSVLLSTLALVTLEREARALRELCAQDDFAVEANDLAAVARLAGKRHAIGPFINVYNGATARFLAGRGAARICLPPELPAASIAAIAADVPAAAIEVFAFGRAPLALSARCAHARAKGRSKDNCLFACADDPDGLAVETLDGQSFLAINGIQTMSHACIDLLGDLAGLVAQGVRSFRLSPQACDMVAVAAIHRAVLDGTLAPDAAQARLEAAYPGIPFANGFLHGTAGAARVSDEAVRAASRPR